MDGTITTRGSFSADKDSTAVSEILNSNPHSYSLTLLLNSEGNVEGANEDENAEIVCEVLRKPLHSTCIDVDSVSEGMDVIEDSDVPMTSQRYINLEVDEAQNSRISIHQFYIQIYFQYIMILV